jgi:hypothetical protein
MREEKGPKSIAGWAPAKNQDAQIFDSPHPPLSLCVDGRNGRRITTHTWIEKLVPTGSFGRLLAANVDNQTGLLALSCPIRHMHANGCARLLPTRLWYIYSSNQSPLFPSFVALDLDGNVLDRLFLNQLMARTGALSRAHLKML